MNVLAGLAEGVLDAVLEREDDRGRDPFALALERYREIPFPEELATGWRERVRARRGDERAAAVLKKLDRDLLAGIFRYATTPPETTSVETDEAPPPNVAPIGQGRAMPSLELGADGTWHVADSGRAGGDPARARLGLSSRYPSRRVVSEAPLPQIHRRTERPDTDAE